MTHKSKYFYGNKISDYGIQNGYVDYATLAKAFDAVLSNDIISKTNYVVGEWEQISGGVDYEEIEELQEKLEELEDRETELICEDMEETPEYENLKNEIDSLKEEIEELENFDPDIFQYYIVSDNAVDILQEAGEIVFYNDELDMYIWGVTHYGTSWDYVLTNIKIELEGEQ